MEKKKVIRSHNVQKCIIRYIKIGNRDAIKSHLKNEDMCKQLTNKKGRDTIRDSYSTTLYPSEKGIPRRSNYPLRLDNDLHSVFKLILLSSIILPFRKSRHSYIISPRKSHILIVLLNSSKNTTCVKTTTRCY